MKVRPHDTAGVKDKPAFLEPPTDREEIMSIKRTVVIAAFILGVGSLILASPAASASRKLLAMGATQSSSSHYAYFVAIAKIMNTKVPDLNVSVVETGASVDNINRINKGDLDMGMTTIHLQYGVRGLATGRANQSGPVCPRLPVRAAEFCHSADSGVKIVADAASRSRRDARGLPRYRGDIGPRGSCQILPRRTGTVAAIKDNRIVGYAKSGAGTKARPRRRIHYLHPVGSSGSDKETKPSEEIPQPHSVPGASTRFAHPQDVAICRGGGRQNISEDLGTSVRYHGELPGSGRSLSVDHATISRPT
jgi:hypothetical protein